jgi:hypothetical protein
MVWDDGFSEELLFWVGSIPGTATRAAPHDIIEKLRE